MVLMKAVGSVMTIIIMFMTGFFMTKKGILTQKTGDTFSKIILNVSLPAYMLWNIMSNFDRAKLQELGGGFIVPVLSITITYITGIIASKLLRVRKGRIGVFRSVFFTSNTIYIGLAVNLSLFGESSIPYVLIYYIVNTTFFWTVGVYEISKDGLEGQNRNFFSRELLKKLVSPALMGFASAILLILLGVKLPVFIMDSCKYIGGLTTPLAMFFIGIVLSKVKLSELKFDKDILYLIIARFIICPVTVIILLLFFNLPPLMAKVFIIQSAMPAMTSTGIVAREYGADYEFGTMATVITTVLSMLAIPIYMIII